MEYINYVKQQPIQGFTGYGGGANSLAFKSGDETNYSLDYSEGDGMQLYGSGLPALDLNGSFCVEGFFKITSSSFPNTYRNLWSRFSGSDYQFQSHFRPDSQGGYKVTTWFQMNANTTVEGNHIQLNTWHHFAFVRDNSDNMYQFIDGVNRTTGSWSSSYDNTDNSTEPFALGHRIDSGIYDFIGKISNVRYTVGQPVYSGSFTPATSPLTTTSQSVSESNCKFLAAQSETFDTTTKKPSNTTWESGSGQGDPSVSEDSPF